MIGGYYYHNMHTTQLKFYHSHAQQARAPSRNQERRSKQEQAVSAILDHPESERNRSSLALSFLSSSRAGWLLLSYLPGALAVCCMASCCSHSYVASTLRCVSGCAHCLFAGGCWLLLQLMRKNDAGDWLPGWRLSSARWLVTYAAPRTLAK